MTSYDSSLHVPVAFPKENLVQTLGEVVADAGAHQLRIAETEKYAHVTYFFSGGREEPFPLEDRILVNSPKDVATYDLKPQMSVLEVTDRFLEAWAAGPEKDGVPYTLAVCNLANPDMVGHTGVIEAAVKALEYVDGCVARLVEVVLSSGGRVLMTADHGNVEVMLDETGHPQTAHTCNQVPLVVVERGADGERAVPLRSGGKLGDIASRAARAAGEHGACLFLSLPRLRAPQSSDCADAAFHDPLRVLWGAFPRHAGGRTHRALRQDHARQRPRRSGS